MRHAASEFANERNKLLERLGEGGRILRASCKLAKLSEVRVLKKKVRVKMLAWEVSIQQYGGLWIILSPLFSRLLHLFVAQGLRPFSYAAAEMIRDCGQLDIKEHRGKVSVLCDRGLQTWQLLDFWT